MNSLNALIIEDDEAQALLIKNYIQRTGILNFVGICDNIDELDECIEKESVDLIFLDVMLHGQNTINLLRPKNLNIPIIIISNFDYALQSFHLNEMVDYLMKPIEYERFLESVTKAVKKTLIKPSQAITQSTKILLGDRSRKHNVDIDEIVYIEAYGDYVKVYLNNDTVITTKTTVKSLKKVLSNTNFIRIHRSYLVNKLYITEVLTESVKIKDREFPVSRANRKEVKLSFNNLG